MAQPASPLSQETRAHTRYAVRGQDLEAILDVLGDLTGEISWSVHQSTTWSRGNPHGRGQGHSPCCRPLPPGGLERTGLLAGRPIGEFSSKYRPVGDGSTDPGRMIEALAHYESALRELVDEAHDRMAGTLQGF